MQNKPEYEIYHKRYNIILWEQIEKLVKQNAKTLAVLKHATVESGAGCPANGGLCASAFSWDSHDLNGRQSGHGTIDRTGSEHDILSGTSTMCLVTSLWVSKNEQRTPRQT